jgi:hypothetical protein
MTSAIDGAGSDKRARRWQMPARLIAGLLGFLAVGSATREAGANDPREPLAPAPDEAESQPIERPADSPARRLSPRSDAVYLSVWQMHRSSMDSRDVRAGLGVPIVRGDGYGLVLLGKYGATWIDDTAQPSRDLQLHRFELMAGGGMRLAPGWSFRGAIGEAHGSDLHAGSAEALQLTIAASVHHIFSDREAWTAGLVYSETSSFFPLLPTLGFVHQAAGAPFRFDMLLPRHVRVGYQLTTELHIALGLEAHGDKWLVQSKQPRVFTERSGGAIFAELGVAVTSLLRIDGRLGVSFDSYTLPDMTTGGTRDLPLAASSFAQIIAAVVP